MSKIENLYDEYRQKMVKWECDEEEYERKKRDFKKEEDESHKVCEEERHSMEQMLEMWGDCEDSGKLRCEFYDFVMEEKKNLAKKEQELSDEYRHLVTTREKLEAQYQEAKAKIAKEE